MKEFCLWRIRKEAALATQADFAADTENNPEEEVIMAGTEGHIIPAMPDTQEILIHPLVHLTGKGSMADQTIKARMATAEIIPEAEGEVIVPAEDSGRFFIFLSIIFNCIFI